MYLYYFSAWVHYEGIEPVSQERFPQWQFQLGGHQFRLDI